ncbi:MAG: zinc metallopeptidase [Ruminococcaceae bacterium]|nr:zinc metallopeptidase [Oscillospiraceae bacterium]
MRFFYGFDYYYVILVLPVIIASLIIHSRLKSTYAKYSGIGNARHITGAQAAQMVLDYYGIRDVRIEHIAGNLSDHYDPTQKVIRLSTAVYGGSSIAAVGVACHEAGHAAQHAEQYVPIRLRNMILPVCNIGSKLSIPLLIIGIVSSIEPLVWIGIGFFAFTTVFQFATLPVEFNASSRALKVIESNGLLTFEEKNGAAKVLKMAAMTYVAALAVSMAQLLRLILLAGRRRD